MQTPPADRPRKIAREDLRDYNKRLSEVQVSIDHLLDAMGSAPDSDSSTLVASENRYWQLSRESCALCQQQARLLVDNWEEWHLNGLQTKTGEPKPWQKEVLQLQDQINGLSKQQLNTPTKLLE